MTRLLAMTPLFMLTALLTLPTARADDQEKPGACRADVERLCKGIQPGGGRIAMCLKQHASEVSPGCREAIAGAKKQIEEFAEACKPDAEKLCKGVQPGQGRIARCLAEHKDQLSPACRDKFTQAENRHPCLKDVERFCKGVQPGGGRIVECLKKHEAELSAECKARQPQERGGEKK